jgi:hypothetical protein
MKCIFCKEISDNSKSVEHIIPESLGNKTHILSQGIVCDKCNQYFALKVEKKLLEKKYFMEVRHRNLIESKKRKIPKSKGIMGGEVDIVKSRDGRTEIVVEDSKIFNGIINGNIKHMIVPIIQEPEPNDKILSRFLAKVAIESLAQRFYPHDGWNEMLVEKEELNPLRNYARYGTQNEYWEYHQRRVYNETDRFFNPNVSDEPYEVLHEQNLVYLQKEQLYLVLILFGIEYTINLTNPKISGYLEWLKENNNKSPIIGEKERVTVS